MINKKKEVAFIILLCILLCSCAKKNERHKIEYKYIFFILIDSCRSDHMGLYGYHRDTTPFIDSLGKKGIFFNNAFASGNHTRLSLPSIFISLPVAIHGLYDLTFHKQVLIQKIPKETPSMPEILRKEGFFTSCFFYGGHKGFFGDEYGLDRGFDYIDNNGNILSKYGFTKRTKESTFTKHPTFVRETDRNILNNLLKWLEKNKKRKKIFVYLHLGGGHAPHENFSSYRFKFIQQNKVKEIIAKFPDFKHSNNWDQESFKSDSNFRDYIISQYDTNLLFVDDLIKKLWKQVSNSFPEEKILFIITADHGEGFLEHPFSHSHDPISLPYNEIVKIPFILYSNRIPQKTVHTPFSSIDIAPTLLDLLTIKKPKQWLGKSFKKEIFSQEKIDNFVFSEGSYNAFKAIVKENYKFINYYENMFSPQPQKFFKDSINYPLLFDLKNDPYEKKNLFFTKPHTSNKFMKLIENNLLIYQKGWNILIHIPQNGVEVDGEIETDGIIFNPNIRYIHDDISLKKEWTGGDREVILDINKKRSKLKFKVRLSYERIMLNFQNWFGREIKFTLFLNKQIADGQSIILLGSKKNNPPSNPFTLERGNMKNLSHCDNISFPTEQNPYILIYRMNDYIQKGKNLLSSENLEFLRTLGYIK